MFSKLKEIETWLNKIRTWWKQRNIPHEIAETVLQHSKKVAKAAEIYGKHFPNITMEKLIKMGKWHDVAEYMEKDYVPWEISEDEKHRREKTVIIELQEYFWAKCDLLNIRMEFEEQKTQEAIIIKHLDKLDAAIQAMEYEKLWHHNVTTFYTWTLWKLNDPILIHILHILLKKAYSHINSYDQYFALLECNGDEIIFKEKMEKYDHKK